MIIYNILTRTFMVDLVLEMPWLHMQFVIQPFNQIYEIEL